jgi:hypothetical protein
MKDLADNLGAVTVDLTANDQTMQSIDREPVRGPVHLVKFRRTAKGSGISGH